MDIKLRLQYLNQIPGEPGKGPEALTDILTYLDEAGLLAPFTSYVKDYSSHHRKIKSTGELIKLSQGWKEGSYELFLDPEESGEYLVKAILDEAHLWFLISASGDGLDKQKSDVLQKWIGLVSELSRKFTGSFLFGPTLAVEIYYFFESQQRPPREHSLVGSKDLISFFSKKFHREHPKGNWDELQLMMKAKLPASASLQEEDDLVILRWVDDADLADESVLRQKLAEKEKFLAEVLDAPLAEGWNEAGDRQISTLLLISHPPLTFYDQGMQIGYKAVYVSPQGEMDEEQLAQFAEWLQQEELPDGTPLKALGIIVPGRKQALAVRENAQAAGIRQIFYVDNEGRWWNPFLSDE